MEEDGVEFTGRTVEDAIVQAEADLDEGRDGLTIIVVSQGSRGLFGIGAESARIRVRPPQATMMVATEAPAGAMADLEPVLADLSGMPAVQPESRPSVNGAEFPSQAADVLRQLLQRMGFDVDVTIRSTQDPLMLAITGDNLGVLIGRRGDNLAALQFMVNLILSKNRRQWPRIVIDVENYRARREESLRSLAERIAYRVRRGQRPFTLEAMPAGDRRVIHLSLRDETDIETYSIGEGIARRVVIAPKRTQD